MGQGSTAVSTWETFEKLIAQAEAAASPSSHPASPADGTSFADAIAAVHEFKATAVAVAGTWQTLDDLSNSLLSAPRR